jgi:2-polyprenyl-3-methyl-5-hydroxy-6-metoxy-1,4-benzoquinol methylase
MKQPIQNLSPEEIQARSKGWWESNPMTYDWEHTLTEKPGTPEFYESIDRRFMESSRSFGHPNYPVEPPFARIIDYAALRGKRVLEIGCGAGAMAASFAKQGALITAIDLTETAVNFTRKRFEIMGLQGEVRQLDAEKIDYPDGYFDHVWSWGVIHVSSNMDAIVKHIHRVLKPGGKAQIMVYYRHAVRNWVLAGWEQGILRGRFLTTSYDELLRQVTDGYISRHLTMDDARKSFSMFSSIPRMELTDIDNLSFIPGNTQVEKYLVGKVIPRSLKRSWDDWIRRNYGWFLYFEAIK